MNNATERPLPDGWKWTTIDEITFPVAKVSPQEEPRERFTYLDISSIDNKIHKIVEPKEYLGADAPSRARQLVRANDVLFSTVRTYLENVALVPEVYDGQIASTGFSVLRASDAVLPEFLFYYCLTSGFLEPLDELQRGTSYPAVRDGDVRCQPFPLPPLAIQDRIVSRIEELFTQLDAGTAALKRIQARLKRYRASVLKAACEGRLAEQDPSDEPAEWLLGHLGKRPLAGEGLPSLPEGWCWAAIEHLASDERYSLAIGPFGSDLKVSDYRDQGVPLVFVRNIRTGNFNDTRYVTEKKAEELRAHQVSGGDILITKMGEPPGDAILYPETRPTAIITADCIKWRLSPILVEKRFFVHMINSPVIQRQIRQITRGVAQEKMALNRFRGLATPLPPLEEQRRIVAEVERRLSLAKAGESAVETALSRAERLRQAILRSAFEGKLV